MANHFLFTPVLFQERNWVVKQGLGVHTEFQFLPLSEHFMYYKARVLMLIAVGFTPNTYTMQTFLMLTTGTVITGAYVFFTI